MASINKPNARYEHVYPVVRFNFPLDQEYPENSVTVVKVFSSEELADEEVKRLNKINSDKDCRYTTLISRFVR